MEKNELLNWLRRNGFVVESSDSFFPDYIFLKKEHINLVIKDYRTDPTYTDILNDSMDIRLRLKKNNRNASNTYFLVLLQEDSKLSPYVIEKDSRGLRKYVITKFLDFKRIPFLDLSTEDNDKDFKTDFLQGQVESDETIKQIINYIVENEGSSRSLTKEEVNSAYYLLFDVEDIKDEN
ncbi:ABC-three component system middle component 1 [Cytobacillus pseudoceanisediminis]|uniref:ABC-three component system middle component 1 n=1 Tax=Cytobacillus pseudoceanisediminis TaxID=3051614 RepID=UPI00364717B4